MISLHSGRKAACILWSKLLCRTYFGEHSQHKPVREELNTILRTRVAATNSLALTPGVVRSFVHVCVHESGRGSQCSSVLFI